MILLLLYFVSAHGNTIGGSLKDLTSCTRFHFEEKVLEKVIRNEVIVEMIQVTMAKWEKRIDEKLKEIDDKTDKVMTVFDKKVVNKLEHVDRETSTKLRELEVNVNKMLKLMEKALQEDMHEELKRHRSDVDSLIANFTDTSKDISSALMDKHDDALKVFDKKVVNKLEHIDKETSTKLRELEVNVNKMLKLMEKALQEDMPEELKRQRSDVDSLIANFTNTSKDISRALMDKHGDALKDFERNVSAMNAKFDKTFRNKQIELDTMVKRIKNEAASQQQTAMDIFRDLQLNSSLLSTQLSEQLNQTNDRLTSYIDDTARERQQYAFFATLSKNVANLAIGKVLIFDVVSLNLGSGYSGVTGKFTCHVDGYYTFSWTTLSYPKKDFTSSLVVNGKGVAGNVVDNESTSDALSSSSTVIVNLKKGDSVWLEVRETATNFIYAKWNIEPSSMFSGFKIN